MSGSLTDTGSSGAWDDEASFTGHVRDAGTGLVYMRARYMDPVLGRFLSSDPVGFAEGGAGYFGRYHYAANDPVNKYDPDGEQAVAVGGRLALAGGAAAIDGPLLIGDAVAVGILIYTGAQLIMNNDASGTQIHDGKQGKHVRGHKNFQLGKSEVDHPDLQRLVDEKAGTGEQIGDTPVGEARSKERVDFGEPIGTHVDGQAGERSETSVGIIHHGKKGVHVVPARPDPPDREQQ